MGPGPRGKIKAAAGLPRGGARPWSPSPATSTWATPTSRCPSEPADPEMLTALAERWGLTSPVERVLTALSR